MSFSRLMERSSGVDWRSLFFALYACAQCKYPGYKGKDVWGYRYWNHQFREYDVTNHYNNVTNRYFSTKPATMTLILPLLYRHYPHYYDVKCALPPLLLRHYSRYYDTLPATIKSLTTTIMSLTATMTR